MIRNRQSFWKIVLHASGFVAAAVAFSSGRNDVGIFFSALAILNLSTLIPSSLNQLFPTLPSREKLTSITGPQLSYSVGLAFVALLCTTALGTWALKSSGADRLFLSLLAVSVGVVTCWLFFAVWWLVTKIPRVR